MDVLEKQQHERLLQTISHVEVSALNKTVFEQGQLQYAQKTLLRVGQKYLGPVSADRELQVREMLDIDRLDELLLRVTEVKSWDELLATEQVA